MIQGHLEEEHTLRLRTELATGEYGPDKFSFSVNIDGRAVFVEMKNRRVIFFLEEMLAESLELIEKGEAQNGEASGN